MADKTEIFYPDTIKDQPLDTSATGITISSGSSSQGASAFETNTPTTVTPAPLVAPIVAKDLVSKSLNTQTNQILGKYTFGKVGSMQVGEYVNGSSGDIRITPDGITARNSAGTTTFSIDGTTGDATFLGTIAANSVISANISANQITSGTLTSINIIIGSSNNVFKADSNGIYLGNATFASAPFRVTMAGAVTASSLTLTNASIGSGSSYTGNQIAEAYIGTLSASKISTSTLSAISADLGTVTAGSITGVTITGGTIRTASSGARVEMNGSNNRFEIYNSSGLAGYIQQYSNNVGIIGTNYDVVLSGTNYVKVTQSILWVDSDIELNNTNINEVGELKFNNSSQYINTDSNDMRVHVGANFEVYQGSTIRAIIDENIWTDGTYYEGCSAFIGEPFEILKTIVGSGNNKSLSGSNLVPLDHDKVHAVLKADFTDKNGVLHHGMSLSGLVKVQNEAILQLKNRLEVLELKY